MVNTPYIQRKEFEDFKRRALHFFRIGSIEQIDATDDIPFSNSNSVIEPLTISGPTTFTADTVGAIAGSSSSRRVTADGVNVPTLTGFKEMFGSPGYDNTNGVVNLFMFYYDGVDYWYSVTQGDEITTTTTTTTTAAPGLVEINFENATNISESPANSWIATTLDNVFGHTGLSNLSLPINTAGWIECEYADSAAINAVFGFNTTNAQEGYGTMEYGIDISTGGEIFRAPAITTISYSLSTGQRVRIYRAMPSGTVTIETFNGATWDVRYTYASTTTAALYIVTDIYGSIPTSGKLVNPKGSGIS